MRSQTLGSTAFLRVSPRRRGGERATSVVTIDWGPFALCVGDGNVPMGKGLFLQRIWRGRGPLPRPSSHFVAHWFSKEQNEAIAPRLLSAPPPPRRVTLVNSRHLVAQPTIEKHGVAALHSDGHRSAVASFA